MKIGRFSESQIVAILNQASSGVPVPALCREHGISSSTFYKWRSKYGGMDVSMLRRMKELESELSRFRRMYADKSLQYEIVKEALEKSSEASLPSQAGLGNGIERQGPDIGGLPRIRYQRRVLSLRAQARRGERGDPSLDP